MTISAKGAPLDRYFYMFMNIRYREGTRATHFDAVLSTRQMEFMLCNIIF